MFCRALNKGSATQAIVFHLRLEQERFQRCTFSFPSCWCINKTLCCMFTQNLHKIRLQKDSSANLWLALRSVQGSLDKMRLETWKENRKKWKKQNIKKYCFWMYYLFYIATLKFISKPWNYGRWQVILYRVRRGLFLLLKNLTTKVQY